MNIEPLRNNILFQFKDKTTTDGLFVAIRKSGIVVDLGRDHEQSGTLCREATITSVGIDIDIEEFNTGDTIVIQNLMWTKGFNYNNERHWMTRPENIVGVIG